MLLSLLGDVGSSMTSGLSALGLGGVLVWERSWESPLSIHFSLELLFILSEVIAEAERDWLRRWTSRSHRCFKDVERALSALPELRASDLELNFHGAELLAIGKTMCGKAGGPDGWTQLLSEAAWHDFGVRPCVCTPSHTFGDSPGSV